jgi:hypothetical protein
MPVLLTTCTGKEPHVVIMFFWAEDVRSVESHCRLSAQCGDSVCCSEACTSGLTCSKVAEQVPLMNNQGASPH